MQRKPKRPPEQPARHRFAESGTGFPKDYYVLRPAPAPESRPAVGSSPSDEDWPTEALWQKYNS